VYHSLKMPARSRWQRLSTEGINPSSRAIDTLPLTDMVAVMVRDHRRVLAAVAAERTKIAKAAGIVARQLQKGGRLIFVGAGTSGRLGLLEAAEMPPTFGISRETVIAVLAGGPAAVYRAKEGAEDDNVEGRRALARLRPTKNDVVIGISASGVTPFVEGAVSRARTTGSAIVTITCNVRSPLKRLADVAITLQVGPEVIAGSTRLKAGTATKIALNILTTTAMIRIGKTYGNLMVDVKATNEKLRDRARRILASATGLDYDASGELLRAANWNLKAAIVMQKTGLPERAALARVGAAGDSVRKALLGSS
jgi:N-acetylmuramic acid 6-phosphate etherase